MTDEMLALARVNAAKAGATNVEFLRGTIEAIPLPAATIDVVISNCVINLSVDKPAVFAETFRVLVPGGRIGITDVVADDELGPTQRAERGSYVSCIAGALSFTEYRDGLAAAGFADIEITPTQQIADGMHSAIIRATKPPTHRAVPRGRSDAGTAGPAAHPTGSPPTRPSPRPGPLRATTASEITHIDPRQAGHRAPEA